LARSVKQQEVPMRQYADIAHEDQDSSDVLSFLRLRGIVPENGRFTEQQLGRELHRYGWRWARTSDGVTAEKAYPRPGEAPERIAARKNDPIEAFVEVLRTAIQADEARGRWPAGPGTVGILAKSPAQRTIALIEAKGGKPYTSEEAEEYRISLWRWYVAYAQAPFLLLTTGERGFLWDQRDRERSFYQPATRFSVAPVLAHYVPTWQEGELLGRDQAQRVIAQWLDDVAWPMPGQSPSLPAELVNSPFIAALDRAVIEVDQPL
jgi:hypothetical protein